MGNGKKRSSSRILRKFFHHYQYLRQTIGIRLGNILYPTCPSDRKNGKGLPCCHKNDQRRILSNNTFRIMEGSCSRRFYKNKLFESRYFYSNFIHSQIAIFCHEQWYTNLYPALYRTVRSQRTMDGSGENSSILSRRGKSIRRQSSPRNHI